MREKLPMVFCFGSNLAGIHGAGAALHAANKHAAVRGMGFGYASRWDTPRNLGPKYLVAHSFAIPTKDENLQTMSYDRIEGFVKAFCEFAIQNPHLEFKMTQIGCGLAGLDPKQMAWMFVEHEMRYDSNILYDSAWEPFMLKKAGTRYWGTA